MEPMGSPGDDAGAVVGASPPTEDPAFDLSMAVSQLASNTTDARIMLKLLASQLADALGDRLEVERAGGRFRKSDEIKSVRVSLGNDTLEADIEGRRCAAPSVTHRAVSAFAANRWTCTRG